MVHSCRHTEKISTEVHSETLEWQFWKWDGLHPNHFTYYAFSPLTQFHYLSANWNAKLRGFYFSKIPFTTPICSYMGYHPKREEGRKWMYLLGEEFISTCPAFTFFPEGSSFVGDLLLGLR